MFPAKIFRNLMPVVMFLASITSSLADEVEADGSESTPDAVNDSDLATTESAQPETDAVIVLEGPRLEAVAALFGSSCSLCHGVDGSGEGESVLDLTNGTWNHGGSLDEIIRTITEGVPDTLMKPQAGKLTAEQIGDLALFVKQLALEKHAETEASKRDEATRLTDSVAGSLPDAPTIPVMDRKNFIDEFIFGRMEEEGIPHAGLCSDAEFIRRLYLDLWGRLPDADAVRKFVGDGNPDKRNKLIDQLLAFDYEELRVVIVDLAKINPSWDPKRICEELLNTGVRFKPSTEEDKKNLERVVGHITRNLKLKEEAYKGPRYWMVEKPFLSKWSFFFEDLFRNGLDGPGNNQALFHEYLVSFLRHNLPYDYVVREMLTVSTPNSEASGVSGLLARHGVMRNVGGVFPEHEDLCDEIAVNVSRCFLGIDLGCISCHDGKGHLEKVNLWLSGKTRDDFWHQAAFFGNTRVFRPAPTGPKGHQFAVMDSTSMRTGKNVGMVEFPFKPPQTGSDTNGYDTSTTSVLRIARSGEGPVQPAFLIGGEKPSRDAGLREEYSRMITANSQFARHTVNLIWTQFMTVGIVDPPFGWDLARQDPENPPPPPWKLQPSHPELLDALAVDFVKNNYDMRRLMRTVCRSNAYQLSCRFDGEYKAEYDRYYARKLVRRLSAEEVYDAIAKATNVFGHGTDKIPDWSGYMMELPSPDGQYAQHIMREFMYLLGRGDRNSKMPDTNMSIVVSSLLLYSDIIKEKVLAATEGSRTSLLLNEIPVWTWRDTEGGGARKVVEELYLWTLSRFPSDVEMASAVSHLEDYRDLGVEDLQWALINQPEMMLNY
jgi:cytochrome c553